MLDYRVLEREVLALDLSIGRQLELISGLKERLRDNAEGMGRETHLLGELTREIVLLRELRDRRYDIEARVRAAGRSSSHAGGAEFLAAQ